MRSSRLVVAVVALVSAAVPIAGHAVEHAAPKTFVFNGEGNRLNAYDAETGEKQTVIHSASDPDVDDGRLHRDMNAQICFFTDDENGKTYFVAGEDTAQGSVEGDPGWGIFELKGDEQRDVHALDAEQKGKLVPTYGNTIDNPENYGCGQLDNNHILTTDVGDQMPGAPGNGQLIVWLADTTEELQSGYSEVGNVPQASDVPYCKIDTTIGTAGGMWVEQNDPATASDDVVYVASARPADQQGWGVFRYTGIGDVDSCDDVANVEKSVFISGSPLSMTPSAIYPSGRDTWYVSSVFDGNVAEYTTDGVFLRHVTGGPAPVTPPVGQLENVVEQLPLAGTPFGIGVEPDGTLWYADIGVLGPGPADAAGSVKRVSFNSSAPVAVPSPPETIDRGLAFPDGIGILVLD